MLHEHFKLKDLGLIMNILGITIHHNLENGMLNLSQPDKINGLAMEFGLADCKPLCSPLPAGCNLEVINSSPVNCNMVP